MSLPLDTLFASMTPAQVKRQLYTLLDGLGLQTTAWFSGAPTRTLIAIVAPLLSGLANVGVLLARSGFLDTAEGEFLKLLARLVYKVEPIEATFATGAVTLDNVGGGSFDSPGFDAGDVVFRNVTTDATYVNSAPFALAALQTGLVVPVVAQQLGAALNAAPGEVSEIVTTMLGVNVTNALAIEGRDAELPDELRQRCLDSLGALSPAGPQAAFDYVARTPELNGGVAVTRSRKVPPTGDGTLLLIVAGPGGALSSPDVALVQAGVDAHATPDNTTAIVQSATNKALSYVVTVYVDADANRDDVYWEELTKATLVEYVRRQPIGGQNFGAGGVVPWRGVIGELRAIRVDDVPGYVLQAGLASEADTAIAGTEVPVLDETDVTVTVVQVAT